MESKPGEKRLHPGWWALILIVAIVAFIYLTLSLFNESFRSFVPVTLASDRAGLVMEPGAKVKMRGIQVGRVARIQGGDNAVTLQLQIDPDQVKYIPANVAARIQATTAFGAKYVDLLYPSDPSPQRLQAGAVIQSKNVSTEVNTVFQSLVGVLDQIDPTKLNGTLSALADGLRGQGPTIGEATTDANEVLLAVNPRAETVRGDWHSLRGFSDTYTAAAHNILTVLDSLSTTSATITTNAHALDSLLVGVTGLSRSGINLLGPNLDNLVTSVNTLESTTSLLLKYNPELTCTLVGAKYFLDHGGYASSGGNGKSVILDTAILLGDDPYKYPDNLPIVGAKGGPGGKPGCGSLPDVAKNWPVRQLVTNTGWGTGMDWRPNPGIGFPGYADYFPATRAVPEAPSIRYPGGPAPGPIPYPGAPPYGAPMYAPDGTPLYPGEPPAPPPGAPREPGPTPGSEPFVVPAPALIQPTPTPPLPQEAAPSP
jgi:phospholipid/cholesterol/gamma-HCH transport system substrate-binding protein